MNTEVKSWKWRINNNSWNIYRQRNDQRGGDDITEVWWCCCTPACPAPTAPPDRDSTRPPHGCGSCASAGSSSPGWPAEPRRPPIRARPERWSLRRRRRVTSCQLGVLQYFYFTVLLHSERLSTVEQQGQNSANLPSDFWTMKVWIQRMKHTIGVCCCLHWSCCSAPPEL